MKHLNHDDIMNSERKQTIEKTGCINCTKREDGLVLGWCNCLKCSNNGIKLGKVIKYINSEINRLEKINKKSPSVCIQLKISQLRRIKEIAE